MTATKKTRLVRTTSSASSTLRLDTGEVAHVGVDVHKASFHVAVVTDLRGLVATWTQPASPELLVERLDAIREQVAQVVYEAGPTGFDLVRRLRAAGYSAEVIAPSKIPTMPGPEAKSDRLDCRKLAVFAQKGLLRSVRVPDEQEEADRQVVRLREQLARKLRVIQQQIKALLLQHGIAEPAGSSKGVRNRYFPSEAGRGVERSIPGPAARRFVAASRDGQRAGRAGGYVGGPRLRRGSAGR